MIDKEEHTIALSRESSINQEVKMTGPQAVSIKMKKRPKINHK